MARTTDLLIIGAGPFGLSMVTYAGHHQIDHLVLGKPMDFWKSNMPNGMLLRSASDWDLDPLGICTFEKYLKTTNIPRADEVPLSLGLYLDYARWIRNLTPEVRQAINDRFGAEGCLSGGLVGHLVVYWYEDHH